MEDRECIICGFTFTPQKHNSLCCEKEECRIENRDNKIKARLERVKLPKKASKPPKRERKEYLRSNKEMINQYYEIKITSTTQFEEIQNLVKEAEKLKILDRCEIDRFWHLFSSRKYLALECYTRMLADLKYNINLENKRRK